MEKVDVYLSLGTNVGDREANIHQALKLLEKCLGSAPKALSSIIESSSWGFDGGDFLNCAVCFCTELGPHSILRICKRIEKEMGRREHMEFDASGRRIYHDRIIDIDVLLYGDLRLDLRKLTIPHPLMKERDFVMRPLMEILAEK